jgi:glycosyltransferase involved in cell wall biosynthesis
MYEESQLHDIKMIALLGSYVPRRCGIGTFTKDLRDSIATGPTQCQTLVLAMDDTPEGYPYPEEVRFQIRAFQKRDYLTAADVLNINQVDIAIVQHEYGIFGGADGAYVLDLMTRLRMPIITTLHTVLMEPSRGQSKIIREISRLSDRLVVMSKMAVDILENAYQIPSEKVVMIPHGIPDVPFVDPAYYKDQFGLEGRTVLLTFGLLSPGKGAEYVIEALPAIVEKYPDVVYVILGATHPHIYKREGNAYRDSLVRLAERIGVRDHVVFHTRFVTLEELCGYIGAADLYLTPYLEKTQITSGTLAYAMGAGKTVISTPFWYAEEMLSEGRGRLFPFKDSKRLATVVNELLGDERKRNAIRKRAYTFGRSMVWSEVGRRYSELAHEILSERSRKPRSYAIHPGKKVETLAVPDIVLKHLRTLTDDTGVLQHAICAIPDRSHGYCTDDNARALIAVMLHHHFFKDDSVLPLAQTYLAFLYHAFDPETKRFHNFMSYDRKWLDDVGSEESHARAIRALGISTALAPDDTVLSFTTRLFHQGLEALEPMTSPRAWASAIIGIHAHLIRFDGDTSARRLRTSLSERLYDRFEQNAVDEWPWCEDVITYDNAKIPHALILSGQWIPHGGMLEAGLRSLEWLCRIQLRDDGTASLIGNGGWLTRDGARARFDQQPVDAMGLVQACAEAYRHSREEKWLKRANQFLNWFLGSNDIHAQLYDYHTGGCRDGLHADGANLNQGAESTLAWLTSVLTMGEFPQQATKQDSAELETTKETSAPLN